MYLTKNRQRKLEYWENPESEDKRIQHLVHAQPEIQVEYLITEMLKMFKEK